MAPTKAILTEVNDGLPVLVSASDGNYLAVGLHEQNGVAIVSTLNMAGDGVVGNSTLNYFTSQQGLVVANQQSVQGMLLTATSGTNLTFRDIQVSDGKVTLSADDESGKRLAFSGDDLTNAFVEPPIAAVFMAAANRNVTTLQLSARELVPSNASLALSSAAQDWDVTWLLARAFLQ